MADNLTESSKMTPTVQSLNQTRSSFHPHDLDQGGLGNRNPFVESLDVSEQDGPAGFESTGRSGIMKMTQRKISVS